MAYKRNQVEEAILRVFNPGLASRSSEISSQLKRLLNTDRRLGRAKRSDNPEHANFAFYSVDSPGRGVEVWFSAYEAFALLIGLRLMQHSWRQGHVVPVLRRLRPELEKRHTQVLKQDQELLLNQELIRQRAGPGVLAVGTTDPVFLAISGDRKGRSGSNPVAICRGERRLMEFIHAQELGQSSTILELVTPIFALTRELAKTTPKKRGRGSV
jgi:hypothetical protein